MSDWRKTPCLGTGQSTKRPYGYVSCPVCRRRVAASNGKVIPHKDMRGTDEPA